MHGRPLSPEYTAYINSPQWRARRLRALERAGHRCQYEVDDPAGHNHIPRCQRTRYLTVHHTTYERLGNERDEDLEVLCWAHHMIEHLMQVNCELCGGPVLEWYDNAERWLEEELKSTRIDLDQGPVNWKALPSKDHLVECLTSVVRYCSGCEGIMG